MPTTDKTLKATALIVGAGPGTGSAIARTFASAGYRVCVARRDAQQLQDLVNAIRSDGGDAHAFGLDACNEAAVSECFEQIERTCGPLEIVVYNAAIGARRPITELSAGTFRRVWETDCFGAFLVGREAARCMLPRARGSIFFTGATAALRGGAEFAAFAAAKHGARALAQSMARELGPQGIHVAHIIVDGPIDGEFVRTTFPALVADRPDDGLLDPEAIASNYLMLHNQPRNAWTHELDLRPWVEPW
jgi:NAD(P)-dependent dehydrogenase (short-subunit alcohol dehydrogenase family)